MIYHPTELMLDDRQREKLQGYDPGFPYTAIDCRFDGYSGPCVDWHWHATLEINVCVSGVLKTSTQRGEYLVKPGDAVLVNANVLHRNEAEGGARGVRVQTHMFDRALVAAAELPLRRYVAPVVECALLDALPLSRGEPRQRAVLEALDRAFIAAGEEKDGYELEICGLLNRAWQGIYALAQPVIGARQPLPRMETARLKQMLGFIREHLRRGHLPRGHRRRRGRVRARMLPLLQAGTGHHAAFQPHGLPRAQGRRTSARDGSFRHRHRLCLRLCHVQLLRQGLSPPHEPFAARLSPRLRRDGRGACALRALVIKWKYTEVYWRIFRNIAPKIVK